jgi:Rrf2 family protein
MRELLGISTAASIGIHALVFLAARGRHQPCSTSSIAGALCVSESHLGKVLGTLCKRGFLQSNRGPKGGYGLMSSTRAASVLSVLEAIDGPFEVPACRVVQPGCSDGGCGLSRIAIEVHERLRREFAALSIDAMACVGLDPESPAFADVGAAHG